MSHLTSGPPGLKNEATEGKRVDDGEGSRGSVGSDRYSPCLLEKGKGMKASSTGGRESTGSSVTVPTYILSLAIEDGEGDEAGNGDDPSEVISDALSSRDASGSGRKKRRGRVRAAPEKRGRASSVEKNGARRRTYLGASAPSRRPSRPAGGSPGPGLTSRTRSRAKAKKIPC